MSMGRIARELSVSPRAIYHWVPSRRALLEAIIEEAQQTLPVPADTGNWRDDLRRYRDATFEWLETYPGVSEMMLSEGITLVTRPVLEAQEAALGILRTAGLDPHSSLIAMAEFARWVGAAHTYLLADHGPALSDEIKIRTREQLATDAEEFPLVAAAGAVSTQEQLDTGFNWLLDSMARRASTEPATGDEPSDRG